MCELLHSPSGGCDVELPAYLGIGVEAHTAVEIPDQPFAQIHNLRPASPLVSKLEMPIAASLKRATGLYPTRPFVQGLPGKLPGDQCHIAGTGLQLECAIHDHLRESDFAFWTTPGIDTGWASSGTVAAIRSRCIYVFGIGSGPIPIGAQAPTNKALPDRSPWSVNAAVWKSSLRLDIILAHDLAPDAHLPGEERLEVLGVGEQQRHLLRLLQIRRHGRLAQYLLH